MTEQEYKEAKQQRQLLDDKISQYERIQIEILKKKQKDREDNCEHEFRPTNAKWQSITQQECIHCGKKIE